LVQRGRWSEYSNMCSVCYVDICYAFYGQGDQVHVRFSCFKDLGPAHGGRDSKWLSLVTGVGVPDREYDMELYGQIKSVASPLGREFEHDGAPGHAL
jgi:hypothetical protein